MKPSVFIGSSTEALPLADCVREVLARHFAAELWKEITFELGEDNLSNLIRFAQCYDFAVLVLTEDDIVTSRKKKGGSPRDNVVFELGLFMGALGRRSAFTVIAKSTRSGPKVPSDLLGNNSIYLTESSVNKLGAGIEDELKHLVQTIQARSAEANLQLLPSTGLAIGYFQNFVLPVCQELASRDSIVINGSEIDISSDNFDFTVVVPNNLSDASIQGARKFAKAAKVQEFTLKAASRSYPFYVNAALIEGRVVFYDYPTTLRASHEAVRIALSGPYMGKSRHHMTLDRKEISNFMRTLHILLGEASATEFRDNVKIIQMN